VTGRPCPPYGDRVPNQPPDAALPPAATPETFERIRCDEARLRPGVTALCRRLRLDREGLTRFPGGSLPVYAAGDHLVLKPYPPFCRERGDVEERVPRAVEGRLPVPTPRVHEYGRYGEWTYLLMTRLAGEPLTEAWPRMGERDRDRIAARLRRRLLAYTLLHRYSDLPWYLQELPAPPEPTLEALADSWWRFD
jgi:hygromycin-B 7''-O-kinase